MNTTLQAGADVDLIIDPATGIARVILNRPESLNAINMATARALGNALGQISDDQEVRAVVLSGNGRAFCAGGDVGEMADAADRNLYMRELADTMHRALIELYDLPVPVVAQVHGTAAGAGLGIVLAADFVIASGSAQFLTAYTRIGLTPDCGVSYLLPMTIGPRNASSMLLSNTRLKAPRALEWGLITSVCDEPTLPSTAFELARSLSIAAHPATGSSRRLLRAPHRDAYIAHLALEAAQISDHATTPSADEAIKEFARRRPGTGPAGR
ncbi:enoyl-CoA hydratase/isomerase family protein [Gordonia rubripertincta]|uniref:Enoyl-CoA hydratase/isomerase family protein n=1 Tax=Gordonia rubripertincta TaxID=36822 RepID=A0ABT4MYB4_GORRU|nr:enoyl-CoA hydratase/isomerase family protein [Gordonia rubripertincta]MCZ4551036.1 enoyl-CoA hydratase/isomerase family protein [Gordonia rubripertincta]